MKEPTQSSFWKEFMEYLKMIIFVVAVVLVVNNFLLINAKIPSESMEQTIMTGDRVFGNRLAYVFGEPERYDIIIFKYPDNEKELFIKRIIGMPGETVEIKDGKVYINGSEEPLKDSFTPETPVGDYGPYTVPRTVILYWEITGIIPGIPDSGITPMWQRIRFWEKRCLNTSRELSF